jgi:hypothetical protein
MPKESSKAAADGWKYKFPFGFWQILGIGGATALAGGILYYAVLLAHANAFNDARAFRVLGVVAAQFRSLQTSRATIIRNVPAAIPIPSCGASSEQNTDFAFYLARLDLVQARLCHADASDVTSEAASLCQRVEPDEVILEISGPRLTTLWCHGGGYDALEEPFAQAAKQFISQDFFSETLLTLADGTVLGEFPSHDAAPAYSRVDLQSSVADTINIVNAHDLIRNRAHGDGSAPDASTASPSHEARTHTWEGGAQRPFAANDDVSQQDFRTYVLPLFVPGTFGADIPGRVPAGAKAATKESAVQESEGLTDSVPNRTQTFYVIGLRPIDVPQALIHTLWPGGLWLLILVTALGVLAWPLLKLNFGPPSDSMTRCGAYLSLLAVLLTPALLVIGAASVWSYFELEAWASANSKDYAQSLDRNLRQDLVDGAEILRSYADVYRDVKPCRAEDDKIAGWNAASYFAPATPPRQPPILAFDQARRPIFARLDTDDSMSGPCNTWQLIADPKRPPDPNWSPFRTIIALDDRGKRNGPVFTPFRPFKIKLDLDLSNREYFQALKVDEAWVVTDSHRHQEKVLAQRLFNSIDASKTLQVAVLRTCEQTQRDETATSFCGIITGGMRLHGFLDPESPPLLRFAVIDTQSGTVVFHSNDQRSLAENFFMESELATLLSAAISAKQPMSYAGQYIGDPHNFYYQPVEGTQWGVVVFFPEKELADLSYRAGISAMMAYLGSVLGVMLVLIVFWWSRSHLARPAEVNDRFIDRLWPRVPLPSSYFYLARLRPSLWASLALIIVTLTGWTDWRAFLIVLITLILTGFLGYSTEVRKRARGVAWAKLLSPEDGYVEVQACALIVLSILPAYWLFVSFNQLQIQGLLRDELLRNTHQLERRLDLIRADLRHWAPITEDWPRSEYPDPGTLVVHPDLGISGSSPDGSPDGPSRPVHSKPSMFTKLVWESVADSTEQRRRLGLMLGARTDDTRCVVFYKAGVERCWAKVSDRQYPIDFTLPGASALFEEDADWFWPRVVAIVFALVFVWMGTLVICRVLTRELFGLNASYMNLPQDPEPIPAAAPSEDAFDALWEELSHAEQSVLYQLSLQHIVSPRNEAAILRLLQRRLIVIDPFPRLRSEELGAYIRSVDTKAFSEELARTADKGTWRRIGPPLFVLLMVLIAWLSWAQGGVLKALSAIVIATGAFLGQIMQLLSLARTGFAPKSAGGDGASTPADDS